MTSESLKGDGWGWQALVKQARNRLVERGWPIPNKPQTDIKILELPEDVGGVSDLALGNLGFRLQGWYSYAAAELAFAQAELAAAVEFFDVKLGDKMHQVSGKAEKREVKEIVRSLAISQSADLKRFLVVKTQLDQRARSIAGLVQSLEIRCRAVQNEQIRRASERKVER
jgi:hypothetical protein